MRAIMNNDSSAAAAVAEVVAAAAVSVAAAFSGGELDMATRHSATKLVSWSCSSPRAIM